MEIEDSQTTEFLQILSYAWKKRRKINNVAFTIV